MGKTSAVLAVLMAMSTPVLAQTAGTAEPLSRPPGPGGTASEGRTPPPRAVEGGAKTQRALESTGSATPFVEPPRDSRRESVQPPPGTSTTLTPAEQSPQAATPFSAAPP